MDLGDTIQPITSEPQFPHLLKIGQSRPQRLTVKVERETVATPACQAAIGQKMEAPPISGELPPSPRQSSLLSEATLVYQQIHHLLPALPLCPVCGMDPRLPRDPWQVIRVLPTSEPSGEKSQPLQTRALPGLTCTIIHLFINGIHITYI